jgi:hypothetical protein
LKSPILFFISFTLLLVLLSSCSKEKGLYQLEGTGSFVFTSDENLANKTLSVFYHVPSNADESSPVLFVFHGAERNGRFSRDQLINIANQKNCILVCPKFSEATFPGGDAYNLGNIFTDGDNPSASNLNDESLWTFTIIEPLFDYIKLESISEANTYDIFGHSAGAQFAHRFLIFKPEARLNKSVIAGSGWYTMLDKTISFPYGLANSPAEQIDLSNLYSKEIHIVIGDQDNDPNFPGLRHNSTVDTQGLNRLERANYFFNQAEINANNLSQAFSWQQDILPGIGHNFTAYGIFALGVLYD